MQQNIVITTQEQKGFENNVKNQFLPQKSTRERFAKIKKKKKCAQVLLCEFKKEEIGFRKDGDKK